MLAAYGATAVENWRSGSVGGASTNATKLALSTLDSPGSRRAEDLAGSWTGRLLLYYRSPARITLTLARPGTRWEGELDLAPDRFTGPERFVLEHPEFVDGVLTFEVPNKKYESGRVRYRAVLRDGRLVGVAEYSDAERGARAIGSWTATR